MIYADLNKALYGALIANLLFWRDMYGDLGSWGIELNQYVSCIMNKTVDEKQCTICWHMDGIKISHLILKVVDRVLSQMTTKYERVSPLSVSRGHVHDYLGMRLDYGTQGKDSITMPKHIKSIQEDTDGIYETPSANHMFIVKEDVNTLTGIQADLF